MLDIADRYVEKMTSMVNKVGTRNKVDNSNTFVFNTKTRKAFTFKNHQREKQNSKL